MVQDLRRPEWSGGRPIAVSLDIGAIKVSHLAPALAYGWHTGERSPDSPMLPAPDRSDNELMLRVQAGELEAFEQLVQRFQAMVHGLAMSMLRRPEDAEEAAQDTFVKLYRARHRFDGQRKLGPWLLRIAGNTCRDQLRRRRVSELPTLRLDADGRDVLGELADHRAAVDPLAPAIRSELGRLSSKVRLPLELKYMRGQTNREIAESLGISISNVKVQLARGKDLLASRLEAIGVAWGKASGVGSHEEEGEA